MRRVLAAALAMNTSGDEMIYQPPEWRSPIHASSKPSRSRCSIRARSCSSSNVGLRPALWNGARKMPNRSGQRAPAATSFVIARGNGPGKTGDDDDGDDDDKTYLL